jgi:hypothetical protein
MSIAFAEAGRYLNRKDYTRQAVRNITFILDNLYQDDRLLRAWREGRAIHNAYLEDYAALILSLLALYQSQPEPTWFKWAVLLTEEMVAGFRHPDTGFFDTRRDHETLLFRPKDTQDNATPSGNALAAMALLQVSAYNGSGEWREIADQMLENIISIALTYPTSFGQWLSAVDFAIGPVQEVALVGDSNSSQFQTLQAELWRTYHPRLVAAFSPFPPQEGAPPLLADRPLLDNQPTAYVCQNFTCQQPVNTLKGLRSQLLT